MVLFYFCHCRSVFHCSCVIYTYLLKNITSFNLSVLFLSPLFLSAGPNSISSSLFIMREEIFPRSYFLFSVQLDIYMHLHLHT